jgi:hypothetical protein
MAETTDGNFDTVGTLQKNPELGSFDCVEALEVCVGMILESENLNAEEKSEMLDELRKSVSKKILKSAIENRIGIILFGEEYTSTSGVIPEECLQKSREELKKRIEKTLPEVMEHTRDHSVPEYIYQPLV